MTHPHLTDWRESRLTEWREAAMAERVTLEAPELRPVNDPAPARCVVTTGRDNKPIHIGGAVSRTSALPYAGYGPHRRPPLARRGLVAAVSAVGSVSVLTWVVGIVAALMLLTACSGPSDLEAERATAAALQDAIAQAQAERPDLWTPETIERAKTAALIAAASRK